MAASKMDIEGERKSDNGGRKKTKNPPQEVKTSSKPPTTSFHCPLTAVSTVSSMPSSTNCSLCSQPHPLEFCTCFKNLDSSARGDYCKVNKICWRCLCPNHMARVCPRSKIIKCKECGSERHHSLMHNMSQTPMSVFAPAFDPRNVMKPTTQSMGPGGPQT